MNAQVMTYQQNSREVYGEPFEDQHKQELVLKYAPLVQDIANKMAIRLPPNISRDDLVGFGVIGLYDAIDKFDADKNVKFRTYAYARIKGQMLDELRKMDWVPRSVRENVRKVGNAMRTLEIKLGREPEDKEIAEELGVDIEAYYDLLAKAQGTALLSLDYVLPNGAGTLGTYQPSRERSPLEAIKSKELKAVVAKALKKLNEKEQLVLSLYYYEEMTLKEIAKILDLTEARISQIHSKAIIKLRSKLKGYDDSETFA